MVTATTSTHLGQGVAVVLLCDPVRHPGGGSGCSMSPPYVVHRPPTAPGEAGHSGTVDVAAVLAVLAAGTQGLASSSELRAAGISRSQLSRALVQGQVLRLRPRVYSTAPLPARPLHVVTHDGVSPAYVAQVRCVLLSLGPTAAACGRTAAALRGWGMLVEPSRTVEVAVAHGRSHARAEGVRVHRRRQPSVVDWPPLPGLAPVPVTPAVRTVLDCALTLPLVEAVVVCDSALRSGQVELGDLADALRVLPGTRDARRARRVVALCDPLSGSVLESVFRVRAALAGIEGWVPQRVLCDLPGRHLRVDFCFPAAGLVVEVDGARWHQDLLRDRARDNLLAALGWRVLRFTWAEVVHQPGTVLDTVGEALAVATPGTRLRADQVAEAA